MALPPDGRYRSIVAGVEATLTIASGTASLAGVRLEPGRIEIARMTGTELDMAAGPPRSAECRER